MFALLEAKYGGIKFLCGRCEKEIVTEKKNYSTKKELGFTTLPSITCLIFLKK